MGNDLIGILLRKGLELLVSCQGLLNSRNLLARDVAGDVLAVDTGLELIKRTRSAFFDYGKLASFHGWNPSDLLEEVR